MLLTGGRIKIGFQSGLKVRRRREKERGKMLILGMLSCSPWSKEIRGPSLQI